MNIGTLIPIALFLIVQTGGGIWWASSIHSTVAQVAGTQQELIAEVDAENLRQWSRINENEDRVASVSASERTTSEIIRRMEADISAVRADVRQTNSLLRDILIAQAQTGED